MAAGVQRDKGLGHGGWKRFLGWAGGGEGAWFRWQVP